MPKSINKINWKGVLLKIVLPLVIGIAAGTGIVIAVNENGEIEVQTKGTTSVIEYAAEEVPAVIEGDMGELVETTEIDGEEIPTVEEVDGGLFEDIDTGVSTTEGEYADLGWSETYDTSAPEAFKDATLGRCIIANNRYGAQCVSLARVFWWSYADRDVSTCGTGMAKGMMNCAEENAGDEFIPYGADAVSGIQAGDWIIWGNGIYGHVAMALGPVVNGYVAVLGENQGGRSCGEGVGGAATNIINASVRGIIGFYRPKDYVKPEPVPEPTPDAPDTGVVKALLYAPVRTF